MEQQMKHEKNAALWVGLLALIPVRIIQGMNDLIPFDKLQTNVAIGLGIAAGAAALAAAIAYIKVVHWSCAGLWTIGLMIWEHTLSMFILAAAWTIFAGAAVGMTIHCFKGLTEETDEDQRRAALLTRLRGLTVIFYPISFLVSFETFMGESFALLLGALTAWLIGFSCGFYRQELRLGLVDPTKEWLIAALLMSSPFHIAQRYLEASAAPLLAKIMLWPALIAALIALWVAFQRMEEGNDPRRRLQARKLKRKRKQHERMLKQLRRKDD